MRCLLRRDRFDKLNQWISPFLKCRPKLGTMALTLSVMRASPQLCTQPVGGRGMDSFYLFCFVKIFTYNVTG